MTGAGRYDPPKLFDASEARRARMAQPSEGMRFMSQLADGDIDEEQVEAALSDRPSFRWADAEGSLEAVNGVPAVLASERRGLRRRVRVAAAVLVVCVLTSLLVDSQGVLVAPSEVLACYELALRQLAAALVAPSDLLSEGDILAVHAAYYHVLEGATATLAAAFAGAAVCVGGLLFQRSFHRRFAVAPVAGVSAAVLAGQGIGLLATGAVLRASWVALVIACVMGFAPVVALRFRLNALNLPDGEARQLGVDAARLRRVADTCAVVLLAASQAWAGPVFPLALVVPLAVRPLFGVEFRHALVGTSLAGACALLLARLIPLPLWAGACIVAAALFAFLLVRDPHKGPMTDCPHGRQPCGRGEL